MTTPDPITAAIADVLENDNWSKGSIDLAEAVKAAAEPLIRQRIYDELGSDHHVIFTDDGWTTEHSVQCRLSGRMAACAYHEAIRLVADEPHDVMMGRWRITGIDSMGLPSLERADS